MMVNGVHYDKMDFYYITDDGRIICRICGGEEILSAREELSRDLISIITSFSARLYGLRSHKTRRILEAVKS